MNLAIQHPTPSTIRDAFFEDPKQVSAPQLIALLFGRGTTPRGPGNKPRKSRNAAELAQALLEAAGNDKPFNKLEHTKTHSSHGSNCGYHRGYNWGGRNHSSLCSYGGAYGARSNHFCILHCFWNPMRGVMHLMNGMGGMV